MKTQKRCVVCRKVPKGANYLLELYLPYEGICRNVCRKCAAKIQEELVKDNIKKKTKNENINSAS